MSPCRLLVSVVRYENFYKLMQFLPFNTWKKNIIVVINTLKCVICGNQLIWICYVLSKKMSLNFTYYFTPKYIFERTQDAVCDWVTHSLKCKQIEVHKKAVKCNRCSVGLTLCFHHLWILDIPKIKKAIKEIKKVTICQQHYLISPGKRTKNQGIEHDCVLIKPSTTN